MKLVIADDERLVRVSLASMIKEMEAAWNIAGEATNGEELLALLAEHKPNIAIVDIRMPRLNGLDAIRLGKEISPLTHWIILSGFSDFAYAQQAIKLGASEYLLKPIDPEELERVLLSIYRDNKEYIALLNQQFENSIFALCNHLSTLKLEQRDSLFYRGRFIGWTFALDSALPLDSVAALEGAFYEQLRRHMNDYLAYGMNIALTAIGNGELALFAAWDPAKGEQGGRRASGFLAFAAEAAGRYGDGEAAMTIMQTAECTGFEAMGGQLHEMQQWAPLRALCGIGGALSYTDLTGLAAAPGKLEVGRCCCDIGEHLKNGLYLDYQRSVSAFESSLAKYRWLDSGPERACIIAFLQTVTGLEIREDTPGPSLIRALHRHGEQTLRGKSGKDSASSDLALQVLSFVDKHYADDIGIGQIALDLGVSANHLSVLFQKKTGVPFVKYLTRIRMYKAKELLLETNLQVRQIAERVGYYSTRHFTKLFTETFGSYPSDYRKMEQTKS